MQLYLKNVGRLEETTIDINGITVLCGDNNTGKSTIGKVLYCIYDSFYSVESSIRREKELTIYRYLRGILYENYPAPENINLLAKKIASIDTSNLQYQLREILEKEGYSELFEEIFLRTRMILTTEREDILALFLKRRMAAEFGSKIKNVNVDREPAVIDLKLKNDHIRFLADDNQELELKEYISLNKKLIYIDDPFILEELNAITRIGSHGYSHRGRLLNMLRTVKSMNERTAVGEILENKKVEEVFCKLNEISDGNLIFHDGNYEYQASHLKSSLSIASISTGIKSFTIIKELLLNGMLEENGIMVLDEPEVHLHPEWQILFAEIIVLLRKAFGLNIVLTTHSMDFLSAIVFFSEKYKVSDTCRFYLTELEKDTLVDTFPLTKVQEMSSDKEKIFASLSNPFLKLYGQMNEE